MRVFRQTVLIGCVYPEVKEHEITTFPAAMYQVDQANACDHALRIARVLPLCDLAKAALFFVLDTVIYWQKGFR